jgi:hypothetical protein
VDFPNKSHANNASTMPGPSSAARGEVSESMTTHNEPFCVDLFRGFVALRLNCESWE